MSVHTSAWSQLALIVSLETPCGDNSSSTKSTQYLLSDQIINWRPECTAWRTATRMATASAC